MVKRVIIGRSEGERLVDLLRGTREDAGSGDTRPHGIKHMAPGEDLFWRSSGGRDISVRQVDEELEDARARLEDAEADLADSIDRLIDAEAKATAAQDRLNELGSETLPEIRQEIEDAAQDAADELAELDGRLTTAQSDLDAAEGAISSLGADLLAETTAR